MRFITQNSSKGTTPTMKSFWNLLTMQLLHGSIKYLDMVNIAPNYLIILLKFFFW